MVFFRRKLGATAEPRSRVVSFSYGLERICANLERQGSRGSDLKGEWQWQSRPPAPPRRARAQRGRERKKPLPRLRPTCCRRYRGRFTAVVTRWRTASSTLPCSSFNRCPKRTRSCTGSATAEQRPWTNSPGVDLLV